MHEPAPFQAAGRLIDFMRQADEPGLINLAAGVPGLDALPRVQLEEAFRRAFAHDGSAMLAYHHPEGDHELRELLAARLRGRGATVEGRELVTVTGCTQALQLMLSILVKPGDIVACEAPAYYGMLELLSAAKARVLPLPVRGEEGIDPEEAEPLLERWKPRCLVVCSTLSNPSGATLPDAARRRFVEICRRTGTRIIDDDIYADLLKAARPRRSRAGTKIATWSRTFRRTANRSRPDCASASACRSRRSMRRSPRSSAARICTAPSSPKPRCASSSKWARWSRISKGCARAIAAGARSGSRPCRPAFRKARSS